MEKYIDIYVQTGIHPEYECPTVEFVRSIKHEDSLRLIDCFNAHDTKYDVNYSGVTIRDTADSFDTACQLIDSTLKD